MTPRVAVSDSEFPIVVMTYPSHMTDDAIRELFVRWRKFLDREQRFCVIADTRAMGETLTPVQRRLTAEFYEAEEARLRRWFAGLASIMILPQNLGAATAISWIKPPPFERFECSSMMEARDWARERMRSSH